VEPLLLTRPGLFGRVDSGLFGGILLNGLHLGLSRRTPVHALPLPSTGGARLSVAASDHHRANQSLSTLCRCQYSLKSPSIAIQCSNSPPGTSPSSSQLRLSFVRQAATVDQAPVHPALSYASRSCVSPYVLFVLCVCRDVLRATHAMLYYTLYVRYMAICVRSTNHHS
jgi:hypothetical protein